MFSAVKNGFLIKSLWGNYSNDKFVDKSVAKAFWDALLILESWHETAVDFWKCGLLCFLAIEETPSEC